MGGVSHLCGPGVLGCPFCGTRAREMGTVYLYAFYCPECDDVAQFEHEHEDRVPEDTIGTVRARALLKWNTRI